MRLSLPRRRRHARLPLPANGSSQVSPAVAGVRAWRLSKPPGPGRADGPERSSMRSIQSSLSFAPLASVPRVRP